MQAPTEQVVRVWHDGAIEWRVVELTIVTDQEIQQVLNREAREGWRFESIHFSVWEGSKRPAMAFLMFVRPRHEGDASHE